MSKNSATKSDKYASFGQRALAAIIDGFIVGVAQSILSFILRLPVTLISANLPQNDSGSAFILLMVSSAIGLVSIAVVVGYYVYSIGKYGQTLGKKAMNIKVISVDTGKPPGFGGAAMREVLGKLVSGFTFTIGYLMVLWDPKKQALHDKIAGTIVVTT